MKWAIIPRDEQETIMNINYFEKTMSVYTSRKATANRMIKKIGNPNIVHYCDGLVSGITYERSLFDKDIAKFFSKMLLIGGFRENNDQDDKLAMEDIE